MEPSTSNGNLIMCPACWSHGRITWSAHTAAQLRHRPTDITYHCSFVAVGVFCFFFSLLAALTMRTKPTVPDTRRVSFPAIPDADGSTQVLGIVGTFSGAAVGGLHEVQPTKHATRPQ